MPIRSATPEDAAAVAAIYQYYAEHTAITFAAHGPDAAEFAARMADAHYPFLVAEEEGTVCGFACASPFRAKEAYRWDAELTLYLAPESCGKGLGTALLTACLDALTRLGYLNAYSCITLPNPPSLALHRHLGFADLGVFPKTGYKLGQWRDVIWLGKSLGDFPSPPPEPRQPGREAVPCAD